MRHRSTLCLLLMLLAGCTSWQATDPNSPIRLPTANMPRASVGLEVATVTLHQERVDLLEEILTELDEQSIAPEVRAQLAQNGLRAGMIGARIPESINWLLMEAADRRRHPTAANQSYADELRFIQCRGNKSVPTDIWGIRDLSFAYQADKISLSENLNQAQCRMSLMVSPEPGGANIRILPTIASGPLRQRYVVQDNAFHLEAERDIRTYEDLALDVFLRPGEVFLVTSNEWPKDSLGSAIFETVDRQKILLIRLVQTQMDDLFFAKD